MATDREATFAEYPLAERIARCIELAEHITNGNHDWTDAPTLLAHLRTIRDDLELAERT